MQHFDDLIPEMKEWNDGRGIHVGDWLACYGNYELTVAYTSLFWPEFVIHDDCVFSAPFTEQHKESYKGFMKQTDGHKSSVEAVMNHQHILDLFPNVEAEPTRDQVLHIGRILRQMWQKKLNSDFPDREITVSFPEEHCEDLLDYEVTFFQNH